MIIKIKLIGNVRIQDLRLKPGIPTRDISWPRS